MQFFRYADEVAQLPELYIGLMITRFQAWHENDAMLADYPVRGAGHY
jgi:hypothetical protein